MTGTALAASLTGLATQPAVLLAAVFLATFVLEDAAIIAGGLLAARMLVDPLAAVAVLTAGIVSGDLALHCLGRWAGSSRWVRRQRARPRVARALAMLERRWWQGLIVARFVPALRLPVYLTSGLLRLPLPRTAGAILAAAVVWTPLLFVTSMSLGAAV